MFDTIKTDFILAYLPVFSTAANGRSRHQTQPSFRTKNQGNGYQQRADQAGFNQAVLNLRKDVFAVELTPMTGSLYLIWGRSDVLSPPGFCPTRGGLSRGESRGFEDEGEQTDKAENQAEDGQAHPAAQAPSYL